MVPRRDGLALVGCICARRVAAVASEGRRQRRGGEVARNADAACKGFDVGPPLVRYAETTASVCVGDEEMRLVRRAEDDVLQGGDGQRCCVLRRLTLRYYAHDGG